MDFDSWVKSALSFDPADAAQSKQYGFTPTEIVTNGHFEAKDLPAGVVSHFESSSA